MEVLNCLLLKLWALEANKSIAIVLRWLRDPLVTIFERCLEILVVES